jgi:hypothetical protein
MIDADEIKAAIEGAMRAHGMNQREIAHAIFGRERGHRRIEQLLGELVEAGRLTRLGSGDSGDPFTYRLQAGH